MYICIHIYIYTYKKAQRIKNTKNSETNVKTHNYCPNYGTREKFLKQQKKYDSYIKWILCCLLVLLVLSGGTRRQNSEIFKVLKKGAGGKGNRVHYLINCLAKMKEKLRFSQINES
jgi:hypothetical protein